MMVRSFIPLPEENLKKPCTFLAAVVSLIALVSLSCDQPIASTTPNAAASSVPALNWTEVGSASGPAFQNGWSNYGNGYQTCAYASDAEGQLRIVGFVQHDHQTASGEILFQLPVGYRPTANQRTGIAMMGTSMTLPQTGILTVGSDGNVTINPPNSGNDAYADVGQAIIRMR